MQFYRSSILRARHRSALMISMALCSLAPAGFAQSTQGSIIGTVKDATGAIVPGAVITLSNVGEGTTRTTKSNSQGNYSFVDVTAGHYTEEIDQPGFEKWSVTDAVLNTQQQLRLDATLAIGSVDQSVQVSGENVTSIDTDTPSISATYSSADVANLPVNTRASAGGTSALGIVATLPGVQADASGFSLQGGLPFQTEVSVDGVTVQNAAGDSPIGDAFPSSESISEIRADGVLNNAEYGSPGEITVTTKGGTNNIHGSAFWYYQSSAFDAIAYTYPTTPTKPKLVANTFGGSFGGPVVLPHIYNGHNKSFFFGTYEGWRHPSQRTVQEKVPTAAMKQGDFSHYLSPDSNGNNTFTGLTNPFTGGSYGTTIPTISPIAAKLLSLYPDPNVGDTTTYTDDGVANYIVNKDDSGRSNQFDIRGDQYFGSNQKFLLWGRFTWKNFPINNPEPLDVASQLQTNQTRVLKISTNYSITPALINEFSFGFTIAQTIDSDSFNGTAFTEGLGFNGLQNLFYNGIPEVDFHNLSSLNADRLSSTSKASTYDYYDTLSWTKGRHQMKFGGDIQRLQAITPLGFNGSDNFGTFQFNTSGSAGLFTGVDFGDFLLGTPYQSFYDVVQHDNDGISGHYEFFGQDEWKASEDLTLTYGLRYELHPGYHDPNGDIGNFDPSVALAGRAIYPDGKQSLLAQAYLASANACDPDGVNNTNSATINGAPCMPVESNSQAGYPLGLKKFPHLRFLPRFGFAYRPFHDDKTVVRGGFGLYQDNLLGNSFYSLTGTIQASTTQYTNTLNPTTHAIGFQWPNIDANSANTTPTTNYGQDYFGTANSTNWKDPYTEQWSLSVDHDLGAGYAARVSYIAEETHQLVWAPDENTLPFSTTVSANDQPLSARLFPNWGRINTRATGANENYESAQVSLSHRLQKGLEFNSTYTFAKALADNQGPASTSFAGDNGGNRATSILDREADFGNVYGTRRHRWNTTAVYDLPVGRGREFGSGMNRFEDAIVGGWRLSNIFVWQSGPFESAYFDDGEGDPSGTGSGLDGSASGFDGGHRTQAADQIKGVSVKPSNRTRFNWVNGAAFTCPGFPGFTIGSNCTTGFGTAANTKTYTNPVPLPIGRFGNAQVGSIAGPGLVNLSTGLSKSFKLAEGVNLRAEGTFTNILNHTNLSDPNTDISSSSFGLISSSITSDFGGARSGQVSMRLDF